MRNLRLLAGPIMLMLALAPMAIATITCFVFTPGVFGTTENPPGPCTGNCNIYYVCPGNDSCPVKMFTNGYDTCPCAPLGAWCADYSGGNVNAAGCCTGGTRLTIQRQVLLAVTVTVCTPGAGCVWWWANEPPENW